MLEEKFSCVKEINKTIHIPVPSVYVSNEVVGVTQILESYKRQYMPQLHGIIVDYKNVSLSFNAGHIVTDKPFVHYDVNATFSVFCPTVGSFAKGTIKRISNSHLGCLVLNTINVTIHLTENISYAKVNKFVVLDGEIIFQISHFNFDRKIIRVNGEITEECINLMSELYPHGTVSVNTNYEKSESSTANISNSKKDSSHQILNESSSSSDDGTNSESLLEENNALHLTSLDSPKSESRSVKQSKKSKRSRKEKLLAQTNIDCSVNDDEKKTLNLSQDITPKKKRASTKLLKASESDKKHKKKKGKHDVLSESIKLDNSFKIKQEPDLDFTSPVDVLSKQKKRKRESSSSLDLSSIDVGHKKKKQKHKDSSEPVYFKESFNSHSFDEVKEEPRLNIFLSVDAVSKQKEHEEESSSSWIDQSSDLVENEDTPEKKKCKSENSLSPKKKKKKKSKDSLSSKKDSVKEKKHKSKKSSINISLEDKEDYFSHVKEEYSDWNEERNMTNEKHNIEISGDSIKPTKIMNSSKDKKASKSKKKHKRHKQDSGKGTDSLKKRTSKKKDKSLKDSAKKSMVKHKEK